MGGWLLRPPTFPTAAACLPNAAAAQRRSKTGTTCCHFLRPWRAKFVSGHLRVEAGTGGRPELRMDERCPLADFD